MNNNHQTSTAVTILIIIIVSAIVYFTFFQKQNVAIAPTDDQNIETPIDKTSETPTLSADKKEITLGDKTILSVDNETIFNWFKEKSQLCDQYNIDGAEGRKEFCQNKDSFKEQTEFSSITVSPDKTKIGFTIESTTLAPDSVLGIFSQNNNKVTLLTNYYLGNKFIGFSPSGTNFIYRGACFEAKCGLFIQDSNTLADKASINNPESIDARTENAVFLQWLSDNEVEYELDGKIKQESF